jgi:hypothetical protein
MADPVSSWKDAAGHKDGDTMFISRSAGATAGGLLAAILSLHCSGAMAARGNPFGFTEAASGAVNYAATPHTAVLACSAMAKTTAQGVALSAQLVAATSTVPEHCRISGTIPAEIGFEINLPTQWNGRLYMHGNGGFAGEDANAPKEVDSRSTALAKGFATARTDTGHLEAKEPLASFAHKRVDKLVDHGYRSVHETVTLAKALVNEFYARPPNYAYWDGCSTGGRQGMMSASRYPQDFDGIMAAAPTLRWSDVMMKGLSNFQAMKAAPTLTQAKLGKVFKAVLAKCDAKDGVLDGLISNPPACDFDAKADLPKCTGAVNDDCFTEAETTALQKLREGPRIQGASYFPQYPGVEDPTTAVPWIVWPGGASSTVLTLFGESYMKYFAFETQDPGYDWMTFNFDTDPDRMQRVNGILNPEPELAAFKARNGKILTYWGWADAALNPVMGLDHYNAVVGKLGLAQTQSFYRMFFVPGVAHCSGGYGPHQIDAMTPLIDWVEAGKAPERLRAKLVTAGVTKYNRSYCPYPNNTVHAGGDTESPANWRCEEAPLLKAAVAESSGGGCTMGNGTADAALPILLLGALFGLLRMRGRRSEK